MFHIFLDVSATNPRAIRKQLRARGLDEQAAASAAVFVVEAQSKRRERAARRLLADPLVIASRTRPYRTASALSIVAARNEQRRREYARLAAIEVQMEAEAAARRSTLLAAARLARKLGFAVRSSKDRAGRVSSYYVRRSIGSAQIRISDHEIPATADRDDRAAVAGRGFFTGYNGPEIVIDRPRSTTWLRRALILAENGRL